MRAGQGKISIVMADESKERSVTGVKHGALMGTRTWAMAAVGPVH